MNWDDRFFFAIPLQLIPNEPVSSTTTTSFHEYSLFLTNTSICCDAADDIDFFLSSG